MQYSKPALSIDQQIAQLERRGLIITDKQSARHYLTNISYYRLEGYWWPLQEDKVNHFFRPGSQFDTVIRIYDFDRELRLIVLNMIERIEVSLRARLIHSLCLSRGAWWFEDKSLFKNTFRWEEHLKVLTKEIDRSNEVFIKDHKKKYFGDTRYPPAWKSIEIISFGLLSKLYENLANKLAEKDQIASDLGVANHTYLHSWLQQIAVVRNIAAHHGRLWNRHLAVRPKLLNKAPLPWIKDIPQQTNTTYIALCCMKYLLHTISPENHFSNRLQELFQRYPDINPSLLGFSQDWIQEPLWKKTEANGRSRADS